MACTNGRADARIRPLRRGTEAVITALTRNQMVRVTWHVGSNPTLSAKIQAPLRGLYFGGYGCERTHPVRPEFTEFWDARRAVLAHRARMAGSPQGETDTIPPSHKAPLRGLYFGGYGWERTHPVRPDQRAHPDPTAIHAATSGIAQVCLIESHRHPLVERHEQTLDVPVLKLIVIALRYRGRDIGSLVAHEFWRSFPRHLRGGETAPSKSAAGGVLGVMQPSWYPDDDRKSVRRRGCCRSGTGCPRASLAHDSRGSHAFFVPRAYAKVLNIGLVSYRFNKLDGVFGVDSAPRRLDERAVSGGRAGDGRAREGRGILRR